MPKSSSHRALRVADNIQRILADSLRKFSQDQRLGLVTVCDVEVSSDLSFAKIYISVMSSEKTAEEVVLCLNKEASQFRTVLAKSLSLRVAPKIKFIFDKSIVEGHRISQLIDDAIRDDET